METGAFGSGKAGSSVDPLAYLRKPSVVFRIGALVSLSRPCLLLPALWSNKLGCHLTSPCDLRTTTNQPELDYRPLALIFIIFQLFSVIMFASISNEAWQPNSDGKEICIMNDSGNVKSNRNIYHLT